MSTSPREGGSGRRRAGDHRMRLSPHPLGCLLGYLAWCVVGPGLVLVLVGSLRLALAESVAEGLVSALVAVLIGVPTLVLASRLISTYEVHDEGVCARVLWSVRFWPWQRLEKVALAGGAGFLGYGHYQDRHLFRIRVHVRGRSWPLSRVLAFTSARANFRSAGRQLVVLAHEHGIEISCLKLRRMEWQQFLEVDEEQLPTGRKPAPEEEVNRVLAAGKGKRDPRIVDPPPAIDLPRASVVSEPRRSRGPSADQQ
jgi:hypothetical protein